MSPLLAVAATVAMAACTSLLDFDGYEYVDPGSGGAGGAGGVGGTGGSTAQPCSDPEQCPGVDGQCQQRTCSQGSCGMELTPAETPCTEDGGAVCDGNGQCVECVSSDQCATGKYCLGVACLDQKTLGDTCASPDECLSAQCADGRCCGSACDGPCDACNGAGSEGDCTVVAQGEAGDPSCTPYLCDGANGTCPTSCVNSLGCLPPSVCDASNHCGGAQPIGASCTLGSQCASGQCVDSYCCDGPCTALCQACSTAKTGGANGQCGFVSAGTNPDGECGGFATCDGAGACSLKADGSSCGVGAECVSGNCADTFCCNSACTALCQACSAAKTGGANGQCAFVATGTDPDAECSGPKTCDGLGACTN